MGRTLRTSAMAFVLGFCASSPALADISTGSEWLAGQAQADGSFATTTDLATPFQGTAEVVSALRAVGRGGVVGAAEGYINSEPFSGTEYLARKIIAGRDAGTPIQTLITDLLSRQAADGGFGEFLSYQSHPLNTAFALDALVPDPIYATPLSRAIGYLLSSQASDGSWGRSSEHGGIDVTAAVIRALNRYRQQFTAVPQAIANGTSYLLSRRDASALWDQDFLSASVVLSLSQSVADLSPVRSSADALRARQFANGSWSDDVYTTALALRALNAYDARSAGGSAGATMGAAVGYVFAGGSGEPVANAKVSVASGANAVTNADGYFVLNGLTAGDQTVEARKTGYASASKVVTVRAGQASSLGEIYLAPAGQFGFVQGLVFDSANGQALSGATVSLNGATATSAGDGAFDHGAINPGSYAFTIAKSGYYPISGNVSVTSGVTTVVRQGMVREGVFQDDSPVDLSGGVADASTGQPLSGASVLASNGRSATTDGAGAFVLADMPRGAYEVDLTRAGYQGRTYSFNFVAGAQGNLGTLELYADNGSSTPTTLTVYGTVVDSVSNEPVAGASIAVQQTGESTTSGADGKFIVGGLSQLTVDLTVSATGHETRGFQITSSSYGDVASLFPLPPSGGNDTATSSTLRGHILDSASGAPVANAAVQVAGSSLSATTDGQGAFEIAGIPDLTFSLEVAAAGFFSRSFSIQFTRHGVYDTQFQLDPAPDTNRFQVVSLFAHDTGTGAGVVQTFEARIANVTAELQTALVIGEVLDGMGNSIATVTPYAPGTSQPQSEFQFQPEEQIDLVVPWDPAQVPPGSYRLILRVVEPGSITRDLPLGFILNEAEAAASVSGSQSIKGELSFDPPLIQAGTNQSVKLQALIINGGNLPLTGTTFTLTVRDPANGQALFTAQAVSDILEVGQNATLDFGSWVPSKAGDLPVAVSATDAAVPGQVTGTLYVGDKATGMFTVNRTVVPLGTQTVRGSVALQGVDVRTGSSTDPLFFAVKDAIRKGGEYVAPNATQWHRNNTCLGCHIQTQSFLGLAAARDKATIDLNAVQFLHNAVAASQQNDGGLRISHPQHTKVQTGLGMWSISDWPEDRRIFRTSYRASTHMLARIANSGVQSWWDTDHCSGWWCTQSAMNAITVKGLSATLKHAAAIGSEPVDDYVLEDAYPVGLSNLMDFEEGPDGWMYSVDTAGVVYARNLATQASRTVASGLPNPSYGLAVRGDGTVFVASRGLLTKVSPQGVKTTLISASTSTFTDVVIGSDGLLYVSDNARHIIWKVTDTGQATMFVNGNGLSNPYGMVFDAQGDLFVSNTGRSEIVRIKPNASISIFAQGLPYRPVWIRQTPASDFYVSTGRLSSDGQNTPPGILRIGSDGYAERVLTVSDYNNATATGANGLGYVGGTLYFGFPSTARIHRLTVRPLDTTSLATIRTTLPRVARYELTRHKDGSGNNLIQAWRLMTLAEVRIHTTDTALVSELDTAITFIANLLRGRQRTDGGWGHTTGNTSDSLVTAAVGIALDYTNPSVNDTMVRKTITFLLSKQQSDKSWPNENGIFSTKLASTSFVLAYLPLALERLGGIDINLNLVAPANIALTNPSVTPTSQTPQADGSIAYRWFFQGVTAQTRDLGFDLTLQNMTYQEERPATLEAFIEFANSFNGSTVRSDLAIPSVRAVSDLALTVATDQPSYGASTPIALSSLVNNVGPAVTSGQVHLYIRTTDDGSVIADLGAFPHGALATNASQTLAADWNTGQYLVGTYELYGQLYDQAGRLASEDTTTFNIVAANPSASLRTVTDKPVYHTTDRVQIGNLVRNLSANAAIADAHLHLRVTSPSGSTVLNTLVRLGDMAAGAAKELPLTQALQSAAEGNYAVLGEVLDASGAVIAVDDAAFQVVEDQALSIRGKVTAAFAEVHQGDTQTCTDVVTNTGINAVSGLPVRQLLARLDQDELVRTADSAMTLAPSANETLVRGFGTDTLALGFYTCALEAYVKGKWSPLANAVFQVKEPPIRINANIAVGQKGRILILLDPSASNGDQGDPLGPVAGAPLLNQQRTYLEDLLTREGWSYTIVTDAAAFLREQRSGAYSVYALLSETVKLDESFQHEFREAIYRGEGLLEAGSHDQRNQVVDEALGIKFVGKHSQATGVDFLVSGLSAGGHADYPLPDKTLKAVLTGAQAQANVILLGTGDPVVTSYGFGDGKSVYGGFDLLIHSTQTGDASLFTGLLKKAPVYVQPLLDARTSRVVPVTLTLTNEGIATPGRVVFTLPVGSIIEDASEAEITGEHELTWAYTLAEGGTETITFWIRLPDTEGSATVHASIQVGEGTDYTEHTTVDQSFQVTRPAGLQQALAEAGTDLGLKLVKKYLDDAQAALAANNYANANKALIQAADELAKSTHAKAPLIRRMVGQALYEVGRRL